MTVHRHPLCVAPAADTPAPHADVDLIAQLNRQLLEASADNALLRTRVRDLERKVGELMCWQVDAFSDGELDTERADAFRLHLDGCDACRRKVLEINQLSTRLSALGQAGRDDA